MREEEKQKPRMETDAKKTGTRKKDQKAFLLFGPFHLKLYL